MTIQNGASALTGSACLVKPELAFQAADPLGLLLSRLEGVKQNGERYVARCPAHDDKSPSLSLTRGSDGRALIHCYAGCEARDVLAAVGLEFRDLFPDNLSQEQRQKYRQEKLAKERQFERLVIEAAKGTADPLTDADIARLALAQERIGQLDRELADLIQPAADEAHEQEGDNQSQASQLVAFVSERFELFHDESKDVYARDFKTGETRSLSSRQFRDCLLAGFYTDTGKAPRDQSIREALGTLAGLGRFQGEQRTVYLRFAGAAGDYWLDLATPGSSRAVRLRPGHWEIAEAAEVAFVRPESMQPLPTPVPGGNLDLLWRVANVPEGCRLLVLAWLVECLRPDTPYPVCELLGEQGSAKSTTQTALRRLIDPNACDLRGVPKSVEDVFVSASACALISLENVSHLSAPMQDALCVLATGGGFAKRKLYSDTEESVIQVKRPIILNGISAAVTAQDLVDRAITIETPVITERREVTGLWNTFEESRAQLLGALLDLAAQALAILPNMSLPVEERPRLMEFALLGMAVAKAAGQRPEDFMREFGASRQESLARTIDASPVAAAVVDMIEARPQGMTAPAKEILLTLEQYRPTGCDSWPRSPKGLGDALRRAAPALRQLGIDCKCLGKVGGAVKWEVKRKVSGGKFQTQCPASPEVLVNDQKSTNQQDIRTFRTSVRELSPAEPAFDDSDSEVF